MAKTLSVSKAEASVAWSYSKDDPLGNVTTNSSSLTGKLSATIATGTGAGQANLIYFAKATIAAGGNTTLDLSGSITDVFGDSLTIAKVKGIYIRHETDTTATSITVGGGSDGTGTAAFATWLGAAGDEIVIKNGYTFCLFGEDAAGYAVTATTADILRITNDDGSNSATYSIVIYGA